MSTPSDFRMSDEFADVSWGRYMSKRLPALKNEVETEPINENTWQTTIINSGMTRPMKAVVHIPASQLDAVAKNFHFASRFNLSMGGESSVLSLPTRTSFPDIDPVHGQPLEGPIIVASNDRAWYEKAIEQVILPKLSHAARSWYHLLDNCSLLSGTTTLVPNAADAHILPTLEDDATLEHFKWRRLEIFPNERVSGTANWLWSDQSDYKFHIFRSLVQGLEKMQMNSGCVMLCYISPEYLGLEELEDFCLEREVHDGIIQDWLKGIREMARVTSTRHVVVYTGEYAVLAIFDTQFENVAFSPIEQLDASTPDDATLPSPASPNMFKLITQAMVDARMSKEEDKLPFVKISSPWNAATGPSVKILQYPFRNVANTEPRELIYPEMMHSALTQSLQHRNGFPTIRRDRLATPANPIAGHAAMDVEPGYDDDVDMIMGLRQTPTENVMGAPTGSSLLERSEGGAGLLTSEEAGLSHVAVDVAAAVNMDAAQDRTAPDAGEHDGVQVMESDETEQLASHPAEPENAVTKVGASPKSLGKRKRVQRDEEPEEDSAPPVPAQQPRTRRRRGPSRQSQASSAVLAGESSTALAVKDVIAVDGLLASPRNTGPSPSKKRRTNTGAVPVASSTAPSTSATDPAQDAPVGSTNTRSPIARSLRNKPKVDYTGKSDQNRAIEALKERRVKAAVQKRKQQTSTSPKAIDDNKVVKEETSVKVRAPEKERASRKAAGKKAAVSDAQKKAMIISQVEKKKGARAARTLAAAMASSDSAQDAATSALSDLSSGNNARAATTSAIAVRDGGLGSTEGKSTDGSGPSSMM
ncbi:hypothetical protein FRB96_000434 [Tulasnella sp. 330]|nr:hypothetical protein FRB96_000434 [Tulasnella sp. 330]